MKIKIPFLYVIIDGRKGILEKLRGIIKAGPDIVQLRDKNLSARALVELGGKAMEIIKDRALFFINDRFDIALAVYAQGVHLGQEDIPPEIVRKIVKRKLFIGLSTHTIKELRSSISRPVDYVSFGPVFGTRTKLDALSPRGIKRLEKAVSYSHHPVVAIGGINRENVEEVVKTGAKGAAISSAILDSRNTYKATLEIRKKLNLKT